MWTAIGLTVSAIGNFMMAMPHFIGTGQVYEVDADEAARMNDKVTELHLLWRMEFYETGL